MADLRKIQQSSQGYQERQAKRAQQEQIERDYKQLMATRMADLVTYIVATGLPVAQQAAADGKGSEVIFEFRTFSTTPQDPDVYWNGFLADGESLAPITEKGSTRISLLVDGKRIVNKDEDGEQVGPARYDYSTLPGGMRLADHLLKHPLLNSSDYTISYSYDHKNQLKRIWLNWAPRPSKSNARDARPRDGRDGRPKNGKGFRKEQPQRSTLPQVPEDQRMTLDEYSARQKARAFRGDRPQAPQ